MNTFCTIITFRYLPLARVLLRSLRRFDAGMTLQVLIVDDIQQRVEEDGMHIHSINEMEQYGFTRELYNKYAHTNTDHFRWAFKPVFMAYLLELKYSRVIYADCDIYFVGSYGFLFDELDRHHQILTRHWYNVWPLENEAAFLHLMTTGVFNAGFIGSNKNGLAALRWWAEACLYRMEQNKTYLLHDDQRYLDYLPLLFEKVKIIEHKGCNLMAGNYEMCRRELVNNEVMINGTDPLVFIHFNKPLLRQILTGFDAPLKRYLDEYRSALGKDGVSLETFHQDMASYFNPSLLSQLKWKLHLRTRIRRGLYLLSKRL